MASYADGHPTATADGTTAEEGETRAVIKCTSLSGNQSIRISPMERTRGGWDAEHFHVNLRVPEGCDVGRGMVVMLEGEFLSFFAKKKAIGCTLKLCWYGHVCFGIWFMCL